MNYECLPNKAELDRFIFNRIPTGSFLEAVISNNLKEAVGRADEHNMPLLHLYVKYLYNEAPASCWGSPEKYEYWIAGRYEQPDNTPSSKTAIL